MQIAAGQQASGLAHLARAVALQPDALTHYNYALGLARGNRLAEAKAQLDQVLAIDPEFEPARKGLASITERLGAAK